MLHDRHRRLIAVTLEAAAPFGAALGGLNALAVHGLTKDTTKVIDLVANRRIGPGAARAAEKALHRAGIQTERRNDKAELENTWPGSEKSTFQWHVRTPQPHDHPPIGGVTKYQCPKCLDRDYLGLSQAPRSRDPVRTPLGPVLHPEDAAGAKINDLARRGRMRDYTTAADLLDRYSPAQLISFGRRLDPTLSNRDFAGLARNLDRTSEVAFTAFGRLDSRGVSRLRDRFADWPRDDREVGRAERGTARERPGRQQPERSGPARERPQPRPVPVVQRPMPVVRPRARPEPELGR